MVHAYLINTITKILGLSVKQREVLSNDGYVIIYTIIHWKYDEICYCCTTKSKLTTIRGGYFYGDQKTKCLQALKWWSINLNLRGKHIFLPDFDATMMADCIDEESLDYKDMEKDPDTKKPDKFSHNKWVYW